MFYRLHQFAQAICPVIAKEELAWAYSLLPPNAHALFTAQPLPEQRHALDVALDLEKQGIEDPQLLIAALLHDCGKIKSPLKIWQRVAIVLLQKAPRIVWDTLAKSHRSFFSFLQTAEKHPEWGAEMALNIGLEQDIVELIREHHSPKSSKGELLCQADNRH